jgi:hypothetical protein
MRLERSVTSISWIPSEAITGPMRIPMDLGIGHYDLPPPDQVQAADLEVLEEEDRFRFANHLAAWLDVEEGRIVDAGYSGGGLIGSTTARIGVSVTLPGVEFPVLQKTPDVEGNTARFVQTAGGRTGAPLPRRIDRPPWLRVTAPTAWTTLSLTIRADGWSTFELIGASPFPRHWVYGPDGRLAAKSGVIDFADWTRHQDHVRSPWHEFERPILTAGVESQIERELSAVAMSGKPKLTAIEEGEVLAEQGKPGSSIFLVLDGMLRVEVDGEAIAELGPGAIVGERAILEGGLATATVTAETKVRVAEIDPALFDRTHLEGIAATHRREESG